MLIFSFCITFRKVTYTMVIIERKNKNGGEKKTIKLTLNNPIPKNIKGSSMLL